MSLAEDYKLLERRYLAARHQIEKLQTNVRILQSSNDDLASRTEKMQKMSKEYKEGFSDIFLYNIGESWNLVPKDQQEKMSVNDKVEFFKKEMSDTQSYMKQSFHSFRNETENTIKELKAENLRLKKELESASNTNKENSSTLSYQKDSSNSSQNQQPQNMPGHKGASKIAFNARQRLKEEKAKQLNEENNISQKDLDAQKILRTVNEQFQKENEQPTSSTTQSTEVSNKDTSINDEVKVDIDVPQKNNIKAEKYSDEVAYVDCISKLSKMNQDEQLRLQEKIWSIISKLDNKMLHVLYYVGTTGNYNRKEVEEFVLTEHTVDTGADTLILNGTTKIQNAFPDLVEIGLLAETEIATAGKGRRPKVYRLTEQGKWCFVFVFKENPKESLLDKIAVDQKSIEHGLDIQKLIDLLEKRHYTCKQEDTATTEEGNSICDILAIKGQYRYRIEYERGNYPEQKYKDKFKRILAQKCNLVFVCKDKPTAKKIESFYYDFLAENPDYKAMNLKGAFFSFAEFQGNNTDYDPLDEL